MNKSQKIQEKEEPKNEIKKIENNFEIQSPKQMQEMAEILKHYIITNNLYTPIAGKNYVNVEGWQFAGGLIGLFPRIVETEDLSNGQEKKWQATAELIRFKDGNIVSRGFAVCSNKEKKKTSFDEYAVVSMAQTRAIGKAYRNLIGWVLKLAGYEATPKEEMEDVDFSKYQEPEQPQKPAHICPICNKEHFGKYPKCIECYKSGKEIKKTKKVINEDVPPFEGNPFEDEPKEDDIVIK